MYSAFWSASLNITFIFPSAYVGVGLSTFLFKAALADAAAAAAELFPCPGVSFKFLGNWFLIP